MLSDEEIIEELKLQKAYAYKFNNPQIKMITGCALKLIEKQSKEIEELNLKNEKLYEDNLTLAQEIKEFIEGTNDVKYYSTSFIKNHYISKDKLIELREIDNIDLIQCKLRKLLEE